MAQVYATKQPEGFETETKLQRSTKTCSTDSLNADIFHNRGNRTTVSRQKVNDKDDIELFHVWL